MTGVQTCALPIWISSEGSISLIKADKLQAVAEAYREVYPLYPEDSYVYFGLIQGFGRYINSSSNYQHTFFDILDTAKKLSLQENTALISAVEDAVIYKDNTEKFISITINTNSGLSVYIPSELTSAVYASAYSELQWYDAVYNNK